VGAPAVFWIVSPLAINPSPRTPASNNRTYQNKVRNLSPKTTIFPLKKNSKLFDRHISKVLLLRRGPSTDSS
jgi:hypothetical protein